MHILSIPDMQALIRHVAIRHRDPVMVWGPFGAGKSEGIAQLAKEEDAILCDIRLSQYDSVDLRGFPGVDEMTGQTVWSPPSTLPFEDNPNFPKDRLIILFLDEINAAAPAVSAVAYQLVNDRRVGEHKLMPNVVIVAAGNREQDKGITNRQPAPLSNRFTHCEVAADVEAWCNWAQSEGLPPIGVAFMNFRKPLLHTFDPAKPEKCVATPRTWAKALDYYADVDMPESVKQAAMAGAIGTGPSAEFWSFADVWSKMIPIKDILKDPEGEPIPDEASMAYAVAVNVSGAMTADTCEALSIYLHRMSAEYVVLAWKLAIQRDDSLFGTKQFNSFASKYRDVFR